MSVPRDGSSASASASASTPRHLPTSPRENPKSPPSHPKSPRVLPPSPRGRPGSVASIASPTIDKVQLAQTLDKIHTSASRCDSLTTFNDFAPPPEQQPSTENRNSAGEMVQHGLSGLYTRFREAVGGASPTKTTPKDAAIDQATESTSRQPSFAEGHSSRHSVSSLSRADTMGSLGTASMTQQTPITEVSSVSQTMPKSSSISLMSGQKLMHASARQSLPTNATSSVVADPTISAPVSAHRESSLGTIRTDDGSGSQLSARRGHGKPELRVHLPASDSSATTSLFEARDAIQPAPKSAPDQSASMRSPPGAASSAAAVAAAAGSLPAALKSAQSRSNRSPQRSPSISSSMLSPDGAHRQPAVIAKIARSGSQVQFASRDSSMDRGTAETSPVNTSVQSFAFHAPLNPESRGSASHHARASTGKDRASDQMNAQLDKMRRQVLSKEYWMKDDTVKECFLCQSPFTAFRRKHHCRTCGCIFDSKCTTVVSGEKFGVQGSLRVCKNCLEVISRRFDGSGSDDSGDDRSFLPRLFGPSYSKAPSVAAPASRLRETDPTTNFEGSEGSRPVSTPMMAIPATRRVGESNRSSAVLEIDAPQQLSRPGSSRSLKSLSAARPQSSAGHKRHHSKHGFLGRFKSNPPLQPPASAVLPPPAPDEWAPFRKGIDDDSSKKSKLPAFHDDNIIDPDLADYMSEDSSGDEQVSIFATLGTSDMPSTSYENEKSGFAPFVNASRKHRYSRTGEKSTSGMSFASRVAVDDVNGPASLVGHRRSTRRRNLSNVSGSVHHLGSPRPKSAVYRGPSASTEMLFSLDNQAQGEIPITRSDSAGNQDLSPKLELNRSSLKHVDRLLHQLLTDAGVSSPAAWQKALVPILLQLTDDVAPDVAKGEDMDIRHYVKLKRIPGGKPADTTYVSGVVFTKNLALKSMPRRIANPRIVLVTFPIEYARHQQQFMSLKSVIGQEKEYLRVVVQRITNLRPHLLLAQKGVSGVALQYLSEANIAVAYNVKDTVIEAVARCAEAEIIETLDMLALPVRVGRCSMFEVRTFVNNDHPGRKKSFIFLSGCRSDLGCTIGLRGAGTAVLGKLKQIMEFMVYVVYNLKLESSLLRDECIEPPDAGDLSMSSSVPGLNESLRSLSSASVTDGLRLGSMSSTQPTGDSEKPSKAGKENSSTGGGVEEGQSTSQPAQVSDPPPGQKLAYLHQHHSHVSQDSQVPDDVPMPTFYSDMVAKYETKILSASPYVKFKQPYLLMKAREQERRLLYLRRLRDQDAVEEDSEKSGRHKFQLIKPEMVEKIGQKAPRRIMEILHAVHDAEYDKALFNYQTQTRQWEAYIQGNLDLFDPYSHQNIVVLYSVICTETKIPCIESSLIAINFYDEHVDTGMDPDCTLGQYIEDLVYSKNDICNSNGCEKMMWQHHRTYVHDQHRITVFVEHVSHPQRRPELGDGITMWTYCKLCKKDTEETAMSEATFKYSFGKYLELLYWGRGLKLKNGIECPHDHYRDHVRYFSLGDSRIRVHWDPVDLLEIVVPRARITWKVVNDLKLKNEVYTKMEERWSKFMSSVRARLKSIRIDSVLPEKAASCKAEVERLIKRTQEEQPAMFRQLQSIYVNSKYYEVIPFNSLVREMLEKAGEWDQVFAKFEADYLGDKDMRQLTIMQLKKMFTDNESKDSLTSAEGGGSTAESDERPSQGISETDERSTQPTETLDDAGLGPMAAPSKSADDAPRPSDDKRPSIDLGRAHSAVGAVERTGSLDLASSPPAVAKVPAPPPATQQGGGAGPHDDSTPRSPTSSLATAPEVPRSSSQSKAATSVSPPISPPVSPLGKGRSSTELPRFTTSLSEKISQMRREQASKTRQAGDGTAPPTEIPKVPQDRIAIRRKSGFDISPPIIRAISHPVRPPAQSATTSSSGKTNLKEAKAGAGSSDAHSEQGAHSQAQQLEAPVKADKKLSDRLGLTALKHRSKGATSSIPRLVHKKRDSRVSALAKHFEQLSREFEKERIRDRKQRAANLRQPRARLPRTSTKAIVQVYDNVNQAFEEPAVGAEQAAEPPGELRQPSSASGAAPEMPVSGSSTEPPTPALSAGFGAELQQTTLAPAKAQPQPQTSQPAQEDNDDVSNANTSRAASDDEGGGSDLEASVSDDFLPDIREIAYALEPSADIPLELPKHQKTSLMKYLTNFWAERSASGWPPLEYPVNSTDHMFVDSDIIVREDEPSSVIALALNSEDYTEKLAKIRREGGSSAATGESGSSSLPPPPPPPPPPSRAAESMDWAVDQAEQEKSLLRATGTHLKYQFKEGAAIMTCKIFYAEQFDALRRKCGVAERIVESLSRCLKWDSRGGKTKSVFLKTLDDRLILKSLSPVETSAFLRFAPGYFSIMAEALFHDLPSVIAKMLGFFQVIIKNPATGTDTKLDFLVTENLFYDRSPSRIFDLKGSMRNRKIQSTGEQNEVLLDENMVEYIYESPLFAREHSKKLLRASVWNDTLFLARQNVMDYSLMIAVDEERKELVVGIIDCIRTYTWDKKLESWIKDRGFAGGGRNRPTVTSPKEYKSRFREAMARYILQAPNCWHLFNNPQYPVYQGRARFEDAEVKPAP